MEINKKEHLITAGFQIGTVGEFLNLSDEEMRTIEKQIQENKPRTTVGKKLINIKNSYIENTGILLNADSLLNELQSDTIEPNE